MSAEDKLIKEFVELEEDKTYSTVKKMLDEGINPSKIISILRKGVEIVGDKFSKKEYFLTELVMAGEIFQQSAEIIKPFMKGSQNDEKSKGVMVIGTVKGDVHDIGKNIFVTLAQSAGFEVFDLGVDIAPEKFVEKVKDLNANIVAYSGLLTVALDAMKETTEALKSADLRNKVKIIIGGFPVDNLWMESAGADAFTDNAFQGVKIISEWVNEG